MTAVLMITNNKHCGNVIHELQIISLGETITVTLLSPVSVSVYVYCFQYLATK